MAEMLHTARFVGVQFTIASKLNNICPSMNEWIMKIRFIHTK